jgi:hypothetical protein
VVMDLEAGDVVLFSAYMTSGGGQMQGHMSCVNPSV